MLSAASHTFSMVAKNINQNKFRICWVLVHKVVRHHVQVNQATFGAISSSKGSTTRKPSYYSLSSTASPTSSAQNTTLQSSIKLIYLIPGFALVGVLLGGLIGWVVYRCMLRKPLIPRDDGALLISPRYI
jgi:hypothetical protein